MMVGVPAVKRKKMLADFAAELSMMVLLSGPRVVQVVGVVTVDPRFLGLVMEYCPKGSLRRALDRDDEDITPENQRLWSTDVAVLGSVDRMILLGGRREADS